MGFAAVARVTKDKWVACAVRDQIDFGLLPGGELVLETTICHEIQQNQQLVVIDNVAKDKTYADHHTPLLYGFQSYISVPINLKNGDFFGTLCAIDPMPARLNKPEIIEMFRLFADLIAFHIDAVDQVAVIETNLLEERKTAELREQFIAILGHDLRNPVTAIANSAQILQSMQLEKDAISFVQIVKDACFRITGLIENMLDFARGRLGGGIILNRKNEEAIENVLMQVITEMRIIQPDRLITTQFALTRPVNCDSRRIAQLFSNLLSNALTYGDKDKPVEVQVWNDSADFTLSVANSGNPISPAVINHLFQPFYRGEIKHGQQGLGLGLYIASQIARAHGGNLSVVSTTEETRFTLLLPLQ